MKAQPRSLLATMWLGLAMVVAFVWLQATRLEPRDAESPKVDPHPVQAATAPVAPSPVATTALDRDRAVRSVPEPPRRAFLAACVDDLTGQPIPFAAVGIDADGGESELLALHPDAGPRRLQPAPSTYAIRFQSEGYTSVEHPLPALTAENEIRLVPEERLVGHVAPPVGTHLLEPVWVLAVPTHQHVSRSTVLRLMSGQDEAHQQGASAVLGKAERDGSFALKVAQSGAGYDLWAATATTLTPRSVHSAQLAVQDLQLFRVYGRLFKVLDLAGQPRRGKSLHGGGSWSVEDDGLLPIFAEHPTLVLTNLVRYLIPGESLYEPSRDAEMILRAYNFEEEPSLAVNYANHAPGYRSVIIDSELVPLDRMDEFEHIERSENLVMWAPLEIHWLNAEGLSRDAGISLGTVSLQCMDEHAPRRSLDLGARPEDGTTRLEVPFGQYSASFISRNLQLLTPRTQLSANNALLPVSFEIDLSAITTVEFHPQRPEGIPYRGPMTLSCALGATGQEGPPGILHWDEPPYRTHFFPPGEARVFQRTPPRTQKVGQTRAADFVIPEQAEPGTRTYVPVTLVLD